MTATRSARGFFKRDGARIRICIVSRANLTLKPGMALGRRAIGVQ
jgi:hypothetical protein